MRDAIYDLLSGDATLMATLTGGLHVGTEITRQDTPAAFDANSEIQPCGLLRFGTQTPVAPHHHGSRLFFQLLLYERSGYDNVEVARARAYALLHRQRVTPATGGCWEIRHADDVPDQEDEGLGCSLAVCRYYAMVRRV